MAAANMSARIRFLKSKHTTTHDGLDLVPSHTTRAPLIVSWPQVAFGKVEHLCNEDDGKVKLLFVRRGTGKEDVTFQFKTENVNVNPESYIDFKGTITIRAGEFKAYATNLQSTELNIDDNGQCKQPRVLALCYQLCPPLRSLSVLGGQMCGIWKQYSLSTCIGDSLRTSAAAVFHYAPCHSPVNCILGELCTTTVVILNEVNHHLPVREWLISATAAV